MSDRIEVFVLKPELVDPRFFGFNFAPEAKPFLGNRLASDDFDVDNAQSLDWTPRTLQPIWRPQPVEGPTRPFNDFPCVDLIVPAFSKRAVEVLGEMLTDNGELLPLVSTVGEYYALNVLTKIDCLDAENTRYLRPAERNAALMLVDSFAFHEEKLRGATIFRIPQQQKLKLVTSAFKERVENARLNGFNFAKAWPLPIGTSWREEAAKQRRKSKAVKLVGQAFVLRLRLKSDAPDAWEEELAKQIRASLEQELKQESLADPYWGFIEAAEFEEGEFRIFCTCPDCEELANHLSQWMERLPWESDIFIIKRYGNLYDQKAKEKHFAIRREEE
jgi:hypothetical protein